VRHDSRRELTAHRIDRIEKKLKYDRKIRYLVAELSTLPLSGFWGRLHPPVSTSAGPLGSFDYHWRWGGFWGVLVGFN